MKLSLGRFNTLTIVKEVEFGLYLDGGEMGEILLPKRYQPETYEIGQDIDVFLYLDNEERLIATTLTPKVQVGEFACLRVNWINEHGAFLDWGLMKDLFVPFREQKQRMEVDRYYVIHCHVDEDSFRIMGSAKIDRYLNVVKPLYQPGDEVDVLIVHATELGFKAIIDNRFSGLVYKNEVFRPIKMGDRMKAYIRQVREDGKVDLMLQRHGKTQRKELTEVVLQALKEAGGFLPYHDKSDAEEIYEAFQVSKKQFKRALSELYKRRLIAIEHNGIKLA
ncbi:MAG TPA: S1-like domain-containing RNA-binding protein [Bacteroidaceae bacterium]|nr:S1-like domain-containing RNA-binding protein [Bacteroidaceae bacterium]